MKVSILKGVPVQGHALSVNSDHVETDAGVGCNDLHVILREPAKGPALARVHAGNCRAETPAAAGLDLYENDGVAVAANQIDFAAGQAQIAAHDAVPGGFQKPRGSLLAVAALSAVTARQV